MDLIMKTFLYNYIIPSIGLIIIRLISMTYRIIVINPEIEKSIFARGEVPVYISWHQRFFPGITFFAQRHHISIMISKSKDGDYISKIVHILGWTPVRGSSTKGGKEALDELKRRAQEGCTIGHIIDGPKGPFGVVKPGLLVIAQHSGMPILPAIVSSEKRWVFNSWDKFMVPKPFSRVIIMFDKETYIPSDIDSDEFERLRLSIQERLYELYREADDYWTKTKNNI
ncbi:MAG: lysophospholipid acyltransferase family protein [Desulfomonilia bacterium]|jgi:lysophospholipid acyltransferase (LPLAT)-like uncharacterized protein